MPALLAALVPLIPTLIQTAERLFVKSKAGKDKMDTVRSALRTFLEKMAATNGLPESGVTDDVLTSAIEIIFTQLSAQGAVNVPSAPKVENPEGILLVIDGRVYRVSVLSEVK